MSEIYVKNLDFSKLRAQLNYKIINVDERNKFCYIFCNGAFKQPSKYTQEFIDNFPEKFEFENISKNKKILKNTSKFIFLRDVYSLFYSYGINEKIDNIDKLIDFLKTETKGYQIILCGFSAGAYLATLLSIKLDNVYRTIACGTVYNLYHWDGCNHTYKREDIDFFKNNTNALQSKYFNLIPLIEKSVNKIYYFYGCKNDADVKQCNFLTANIKNVIRLPLLTSKHCGNLHGIVLIKLLSSSNKKLERSLKNNSLHKSVHYIFKFCSVFEIINLMYRKIKH